MKNHTMLTLQQNFFKQQERHIKRMEKRLRGEKEELLRKYSIQKGNQLCYNNITSFVQNKSQYPRENWIREYT